MALDETERAFYDTAKREGLPDAEIASRIQARRQRTAAPSYKLTDYAGEAAKLPAPAPSGPQPEDDSGENAVTRFLHRAIPETRQFKDASGRTVPAPDDPVAHDPLAQMVIANQLGWGAGKLLEPAGRIIASGGNAATQTAAMGGSPADIAKGGVIGMAIPAAGMAMGKVASAVRESAGGQARALWEKHGGNVGPLDSGSGIDEIAGIEPSRAGVGKASAIGARNIRKGLAEDVAKNVSEPYRAAREPVDYGPAGQEWTDVSSLIRTVGEVPEALRGTIRRELQDLGATMTPDGRVMMTQAKLNEARQRLSELADYGLNTGAGTGAIKDKSFKTLANAAKVLVDEGPYAQANDIYERGMNMHAVDRADLGLRKRPARLEAGRATEDAKVAQVIRNIGNDSEAAGAMAERADIPGFVARHPELERQVDLPNLIRAKDKLTFGLGGNATDNLIQAARGHVGGHLMEILRHNIDAANGRLAYGPAGLGLMGNEALTSTQLANVNPIIEAYLAAQKRDQERAAALNAQ